MAADSFAADEHGNGSLRADRKLFRLGDMVIGYTSSYRMGQLIEHSLKLPSRGDDPTFTYLVKKFVPALRKCLSEGGFSKTENSVNSGGTFLVGFEGGLYKIDTDFQVAQSAHKFDACGSGAQIALGSLHSTRSSCFEVRARRALEAAQSFNSYVREPFVYEIAG
jgi:hypothetical protein